MSYKNTLLLAESHWHSSMPAPVLGMKSRMNACWASGLYNERAQCGYAPETFPARGTCWCAARLSVRRSDAVCLVVRALVLLFRPSPCTKKNMQVGKSHTGLQGVCAGIYALQPGKEVVLEGSFQAATTLKTRCGTPHRHTK